ncbi:MAG: 16S rRNA (guanine(966)-N(2))-methyltransferase RsmD [Actinobacteria bacterium]|nr:MAG: 16S rRNA (guanine(966)-N(2))-methyltransferase RsmD [Actinomycetota bacterium]
MRVIAGSAKGVRLAPVPSGTRPMSDRAREGLFSSLGERIAGARVLDLFAGTGAVGIEALSRGAKSAVFVDPAPGAVATIRENCRRAKVTKLATVRRTDALRALRGEKSQFDLVILDPPYRTPPPLLDSVLAELAGRGAVAAGGFVVLTRESQSYTPVIPLDWAIERRLSYGDAVLLVFHT